MKTNKVVHRLPQSSSADDLSYHAHVRQKIDAGLADIKAGRVHSHAFIRKEFISGVREGLDQLDRGEGIPINEAEKLITSWKPDKESSEHS